MGAEAVATTEPSCAAPEPLTTADLTALLERLPLLDVGVPDAERIEQIGVLESIKAAAAGAQARATVAFAESQRAEREAAGVPARERGRGWARRSRWRGGSLRTGGRGTWGWPRRWCGSCRTPSTT